MTNNKDNNMKKLLLLFIAITLSINTFAQASTIYVIFTKTPNNTVSGIDHSISTGTDMTMFRYAAHNYMIVNTEAAHYSIFSYANRRTAPDNPIITKPTSFLNTVNYIDWDIVGPTLNTFQKAQTKFKEIAAYDKIYFIDRTQTVNGMLTIIPVKARVYNDIFGADGKPL